VAENLSDLQAVNFHQPVMLFAQTTFQPEAFDAMIAFLKEAFIREGKDPSQWLIVNRSLCGQVTGRIPDIRAFAASCDLIVFAGGLNSSNAKALFEACREVNPNSHFVEKPEDLQLIWFSQKGSVGVTGATSTPPWMLKAVAEKIALLTGGSLEKEEAGKSSSP
jgi:4-hydroxy-3-methylbut-2-enyl diphosphate reductase